MYWMTAASSSPIGLWPSNIPLHPRGMLLFAAKGWTTNNQAKTKTKDVYCNAARPFTKTLRLILAVIQANVALGCVTFVSVQPTCQVL
jgi:hypothetical protein